MDRECGKCGWEKKGIQALGCETWREDSTWQTLE